MQTFDAANQWSQMRVKNLAWDAHTRSQEAMAWRDDHSATERMQPALELAVKKANKKKEAEGELATSGEVGKRRQRSAERAALDAQDGKSDGQPDASTSTSAPTNAPASKSAPTPSNAGASGGVTN